MLTNVKESTVPVLPPMLRRRGSLTAKFRTSARKPGMEYSSPMARLYQLSGMRSLPTVYWKEPLSPVMPKKDMRSALESLPSGYSEDLFDIMRTGKL